MSFGNYIREERLKVGMSLKSLADLVGISQAYLSRIERDLEKPPRSEKILAMTEALNIDFDDAYIAAGQIPYDIAGDIRNIVLCYRRMHPRLTTRK